MGLALGKQLGAGVHGIVYAAECHSEGGRSCLKVHEREAEMFYVVEGSGTLVTGGKLLEEKRTNAENLTGSGVEGGTPRKIAKGDWVMVPEKTPHWFSQVDGTIVLMSIDLPHACEADAGFRYVSRLPQPAVAGYAELTARFGWRPRPAWELSIVGHDLLHDLSG